ncbi:MAG: hypothetical protein F6K41_27880 [Symploca sp. SIO3E6]|nr:hypothetical protein [Caldora sp. SIO3E6]
MSLKAQLSSLIEVRLKVMNVQWKTLLIKITLWLAIEILLNLLGLDEVADYCEFIFARKNYQSCRVEKMNIFNH